jgi:hypothetical protein
MSGKPTGEICFWQELTGPHDQRLRQATSFLPRLMLEGLDKADENFRRSLSDRFQLRC